MKAKGMSQSLALIIAATVLMITALITIFLVQGGLGDTERGISSSGCLSVLEARCDEGTRKVPAPSTCFSDGEPADVIEGAENPGDPVSCSVVGG